MFNSDKFGMTFWFDDVNYLMYCPTQTNNIPDFNCAGYVHEWDDFSNVNYKELFDIISKLVLLKEMDLA